jgi:hypothetical protein
MSTVSSPSRPRWPRNGRLPDLGESPGPLIGLVLIALAAIILAASCRAVRIDYLLRAAGPIALGTLVLFILSGDALSLLLVPEAWRPVRPLLALVLGAAVSAMVLMAFGYCHVSLQFSLWLTLALGLLASWQVRRRAPRLRRKPDLRDMSMSLSASGQRGRERWIWTAVLVMIFLIALIPALRLRDLTIYGQNPDASQVVGIANLFQHVPPTHTDAALPLDVVPQEWRFRYPIFYPLAAVANLAHADPIRVFPVLVAFLVVMAALGYGLVAVRCFGAPAWAGPLIAALIGFTWILQYLAWHPYWNQLWGTALMPYTLLFGFQALERRDGRAAVACGLLLLMLWFAYPLALPYPLVILLAALITYWRRPPRPTFSSWRGAVAALFILALLTPAVVGSVLKLKEAIVQLLTPGSALWGGDITTYVSPGKFAGTGGGAVAAALVLMAAAYGLWRLPDRLRLCLGVVLVALLLLDLRFRLTPSGTYMDFKHLSFMGLLLLSLAAAGLLARAGSQGVGRWFAALALALWLGAAVTLDHANASGQYEQVTPQLMQIRQWAARLPPRSSVRVDIPPQFGGMQLWAVYMLGSHPVDSFEPVLNTTYAHAVPGYRATYALSLTVNPATGLPYPAARFTARRPVFENSAYVLRKVVWPARYDSVPRTASQSLEP